MKMIKENAKKAASVAAGFVIGVTPVLGSKIIANKIDAIQNISQISQSAFMHENLLFKGAFSGRDEKVGKNAEPDTTGNKDWTSGPGANSHWYGFETPNGQQKDYFVPDGTLRNILNEAEGKFSPKRWNTEVKTITMGDSTYKMTVSTKDDAAIIVLNNVKDLNGKNAKAFYFGGSGFKFAKDNNGIVFNVSDNGIMFMSDKGKISVYRLKEDVQKFHTFIFDANLEMTDKRGKKASPQVIAINNTDNEILVTGTITKGKRWAKTDTLARLTIEGADKIKWGNMTTDNPKAVYDTAKLDLAVIGGTDRFLDGHIHYIAPKDMIKALGSQMFSGTEHIYGIDKKRAFIKSMGKTDGLTHLSIIIGNDDKGMLYNRGQLDTKTGETYLLADATIAKKTDKTDNGYAYKYVPMGKEGMFCLLADTKDNKRIAKVFLIDKDGKPAKEITVNTNLPAGGYVKDFTATYDTVNGITLTVTNLKDAKTILKINNEIMPKWIINEDKTYKDGLSLFDSGKPVINDLGANGVPGYQPPKDFIRPAAKAVAKGYPVNRNFAYRKNGFDRNRA